MNQIIQYVQNHRDQFSERPLNDADSLVLSQLVMLRWDELFAEAHDSPGGLIRLGDLDPLVVSEAVLADIWNKKDTQALLEAVIESDRFADLKMGNFVNLVDAEREMQFAAMTFGLNDTLTYVCFRGTDHHLVGWKEDFNMAYQTTVPSQTEGVDYLNRIGQMLPIHEFILGGHSKGGNVAVYAAAFCDASVQERILTIFNHDGPGFPEEFFADINYGKIRSRIRKSIPRSSVVGLLLENQDEYRVVQNNHPWLIQHNPFTWVVEGNNFAFIDDLDKKAIDRSQTVKAWLATMNSAARESYVNALYAILTASGAITYFDLKEDWPRQARVILHAMKGLDQETRSQLRESLRSFFELSLHKGKVEELLEQKR